MPDDESGEEAAAKVAQRFAATGTVAEAAAARPDSIEHQARVIKLLGVAAGRDISAARRRARPVSGADQAGRPG
jgi:hypothetical protein